MPASQRPGRPRKPDRERMVEPSFTGRLAWEPGMPHPLDAMFAAAGDAQTQLENAVDRLVDQLVGLQRALRSPDELASDEERAARVLVEERFGKRKHARHLEATLAAIRRMRLAARFEVASAALDLVQDLLAVTETSPEQELVQLLTEAEKPKGRRQAHVAGAMTARLADFEREIHTQRERLLHGAGWFEVRYVTHDRLDFAAIREAKQRGEPVNLEEMFVKRTYGPYLDYRWREGKGPKYTVHLGHLDPQQTDDDPA